jgi:lantibiotic modifying enzyme
VLLAQRKPGTYNESNYSLCHGLTGICETLVYASEVLNNKLYQSTFTQVALQGIHKHINNNIPWPCGTQFGESPGFMLGLAGIGYFYIRLYEIQKTSSILILLPK